MVDSYDDAFDGEKSKTQIKRELHAPVSYTHLTLPTILRV